MYGRLLDIPLPAGCEMIGFADDVAVVVTGQTTSTLELKTNESMRRASNWLWTNGLELAIQKTEAVLITDKRLFASPTVSLEWTEVKWKGSVNYLGVMIDHGLRFTEQVQMAIERAASTAATLGRLFPNIGGPREGQRRLLHSVVHAKILYGAEIWGDAIKRTEVKRKMISVQRGSVQRVISAYKTVSASAALVHSSTPPIDMLIQERQEIYSECKRGDNQQNKSEIKSTARERLLGRWQESWENDTAGRWTHTLIPDLSEWCKRQHSELNFYSAQALTGHGSFNEYLARMGKRESAECCHCEQNQDTAQHTIFECSSMEKERV